MSENTICRHCNTEPVMRSRDFDQRMLRMFMPNADQSLSCFKCNYWLELLGQEGLVHVDEYRGETRWTHYVLEERDTRGFRGFDGDTFAFVVLDVDENHKVPPKWIGYTFTHDNVWYQGEIPEHFRDLYANARWKVFVSLRRY